MKIYMKAVMASSVAMAVGLSSPASALSGGQLLAELDQRNATSLAYMMGIAHGIEWTNTASAVDHHPLYCQPANLVIEPEQNISMLREVLRALPMIATNPAALVILESYRRTFPCPR